MTRYARALIAPLFLIIVVGCSAIKPIETAQTIEQKAFAVFAEYAIAANKAANVAEDGATPQSVRKSILSGLELTAPVAKTLRDAALVAADARRAVEAADQRGGADASLMAKFDVAAGALQRLYTKSTPQLEAFKKKVDSL
jgi:hypothetical protein